MQVGGFLCNPNNETIEISMRATSDIVFMAFPQSLHFLSSRCKRRYIVERILVVITPSALVNAEGVLPRYHAPNTNSLSHDEFAEYDNLAGVMLFGFGKCPFMNQTDIEDKTRRDFQTEKHFVTHLVTITPHASQ